MAPDKPQARARLALLFRGAGTRWALPASSVLEVGPAPESAEAVRHGLPVEDFGALFGAPSPEGCRRVTLVLDCAPPRALAVEGVEEVADLAAASFFQLPEGLGLGGLVRGAVHHRGALALELEAQALADFRPRPRAPEAPGDLPVPAELPKVPPGRALVVEAGELGLVGIALPLVTAVVRADAPCRVPTAPAGHRGLLLHERSILSLFDLASTVGREPTKGELAAALDVSGRALAVLASRVAGVLEGFGGEPEAVPGGIRWRARDGQAVLFPELERWVFQARGAGLQV